MGCRGLVAVIAEPVDAAIGHGEKRGAADKARIKAMTVKVERSNSWHRFPVLFRLAIFEIGFQRSRIELASDEDEAAFALFVFLPGALVIAFDDHVHALHHIAVRVVLEGDDALEAQDVRSLRLGDVLDPGKNFAGSISPARSETDFTVTSWIGEAWS